MLDLRKSYIAQIKFSSYLSSYIQEELDRGVQADDIGVWLIMDAIEAYEGGAAEHGEPNQWD